MSVSCACPYVYERARACNGATVKDVWARRSRLASSIIQHHSGMRPLTPFPRPSCRSLFALRPSSLVVRALAKVDIKLHMVRCGPEFAAACTKTPKGKEVGPLKDATAPEDKRMIIGDTFMRVTEDTVRKLGLKADRVYLGAHARTHARTHARAYTQMSAC